VTTSARWSSIAERGSLLGLRVTVACYRTFGRPLSIVLVHAIVAYFFLTDRTGRRASIAYLRRVASIPEGARAIGGKPGLWASFLHYRAFALSIFDRLVLWLGRDGDFDLQAEGLDQFDLPGRRDTGAIVVGAHLGSFDALRALADRDHRVVNVLMFTRHAPRINRVLREVAPHVQVRVIHADPASVDSVLRIKAAIRRGELVAMLGDRMEPGDRHRSGEATLLGGPVRLPTSPYLLAGLLGCPVFFMVALRESSGRYRVFTELLAERVDLPRGEREKRVGELVVAYASRLERYCLQAPLQWFNFFDYWEEELAP